MLAFKEIVFLVMFISALKRFLPFGEEKYDFFLLVQQKSQMLIL